MIPKRAFQTLWTRWVSHRPMRFRPFRPITSQCQLYQKKTSTKLQADKMKDYQENNSIGKLGANTMTAWNHWLQVDETVFQNIQDIVLDVTNFSIIIDDIEDNSLYRDGLPTSHYFYGVGRTINAANYAMTNAIEKSMRLGNTQAIKILIEHLLELYEGQGIEMYWRDNYICPTEEEFKICVMKNFITSFSLYLQILDDYLDIQPGKGINNSVDDITDGKFTLPIIHAIRTLGDNRILPILRLRTRDIEVKRHCISLLENGGSLQYTRGMLQALDKEIRNEVEFLGHNTCMVKIMDELLIWK